MSAYERKLVHDTVAAVGGLETSSEGEEPQRFVVIRRG
jgi:spoIIIJ-associated protein